MLVWVLYAILVSLFLGLAALALEHVARSRGLSGRWIWFAALLASLFTPAVISSVVVEVPVFARPPAHANKPPQITVVRLRETTAEALSPDIWVARADADESTLLKLDSLLASSKKNSNAEEAASKA